MLKKILLLVLLVATKPLFAEEVVVFDNLKLIGKTELKFIGFKIYDIELRGQKPSFSYDQKLAIKIIYDKNFSKKELIETSIDEISRINNIDKQSLEHYRPKLDSIFVDVIKGDRKIAIYDPNFGLELFHNEKLTGKINDRVFAKRFIDIWLSDNAKFSEMRNKLIANK
jgi:hypothetical protein